ncbi:MAG: preprotein translocase subunit SecD [Euryarchaeota archaeon]|nr:preprotein translocase subunit SecD [Euryarchaeota archaeon]
MKREILLLVIALLVSVAAMGYRYAEWGSPVKTGLDIQGGTKVILKLEKQVAIEEMETIRSILQTRLNSYGLKDIKVRAWGDQFVSVDIAGATPEEAEGIIGKPGKLEVKMKNITAFTGGELKAVYAPTIEAFPTRTWGIPFTLNDEGAKKFMEVAVETKATDNRSIPVDMYLDDKLVNSAPISPELGQDLERGTQQRELVITTGGVDEAAKKEAYRIYAILRSGSLPVKIEIVSISGVSPFLGRQFVRVAGLAGIAAIIVITLIIFVRYRRPKITWPIMFTCLSEAIIILGVAAIIKWDIDLPSIAGILAAIGTGVDNQIVITDEVLRGKIEEKRLSMRARIERALFIIFTSAATIIVAMLPLAFLAMGAISGFAVTTIIGVIVGVFITRPAYAQIIRQLLEMEASEA